MIVELIYDMDEVKRLISIPEIWDRAAEDGIESDSFYPTYDDMSFWLICSHNDNNIGLILAHLDNCTTLKMHPYLLTKYRKYYLDMMNEFFKWFLGVIPLAINKLNITIPFNRKMVFNCAKKLGFKEEGINRASYTKDGEIWDQWNMGLTRNEVEGLLWA